MEVAITQSAPRQLPPTSLQSNRSFHRSHHLTVSFNKPFSATKDFIKDLYEAFEISVTLQSPKDLHWNTRHPTLHLHFVSVSAWFNLINNDAEKALIPQRTPPPSPAESFMTPPEERSIRQDKRKHKKPVGANQKLIRPRMPELRQFKMDLTGHSFATYAA